MKKMRAGFTLVEMLVVICIILILASLLAVMIKHVIDRSKFAKTQGEFGGYPSASVPYAGSKNLHHTLGREWVKVEAHGSSGAGMKTVTKKDPIVTFKSDWIKGYPSNPYPNPANPLVDSWENDIQYAVPNPVNPSIGFRVWAVCKDIADPADDVASDIRE
jgi:prepilin-type N-terminal cleavage/methylation domain-containing protein